MSCGAHVQPPWAGFSICDMGINRPPIQSLTQCLMTAAKLPKTQGVLYLQKQV